jgi:transcriptional regulator with XRE-family HTH domain
VKILHALAGPELQPLLKQERLNAAVARQIFELRTERGLSQARLAAIVGTTQSVIARLEDADYSGHSLTMLRRIAEAMGCAIEVRFVEVRRPKAA